MPVLRVIPTLLLAMLTAACAAAAPPVGSGGPSPSSRPESALATAAAVGTMEPIITPPPKTPRATSTPPVPATPVGVRSHEDVEALCDPDDEASMCGVGDSTFTISWTKPRSKDVEIRVYGVKACFGDDADGAMIDGWCLREHTKLPDSVRVLLARAPASDGRASFQVARNEQWFETLDGVAVYAFVIGAYGPDERHSVFAIADRAEYCVVADVACNGMDVPDAFMPGSWMATIVPGVRVRSRPAVSPDSTKYTPLLPKGTEFEIIRGPVTADGYRWYLVGLAPGLLDDGVTRGWLADGSRGGEMWIENIGIDEG